MNDLRYAVRMLGRVPGFTAAAVLTLALGIGVNTTLFTIVNAVLFRPLPGVRDADRLVWVASGWRDRSRVGGLSYPNFVDYRTQTSDLFAGLAGYRTIPMSIGSGGEPERITGQIVTSDYFMVLQVQPAFGRLLQPSDDQPAAHPVVVLGYRFWQRRFAGKPGVIGAPLVINGQRFSIVGIVERDFSGPELGAHADVWLPMAAHRVAMPGEPALLDRRETSWLQVIGRLNPGVSRRQALPKLTGLARRFEETYADANKDRTIVVTAVTSGVAPSIRGEMLPLAVVLLALTALVLAIAGANVDNLLIARGIARRREIAIRVAIGASRGRLVRQILTESSLIAMAAGAAALLLSFWTADLIVAALQGSDLEGVRSTPDLRVVVYTFAVSLVTGALFGLAPAFAACRRDVTPVLHDAPSTPGVRRSRLMSGLVIAQLALSLVLLCGAGLGLRTLQRASTIDLGFNPRNVLVSSFDLVLQDYPAARREVFQEELISRVLAEPGVRSASLSNVAPLSGTMIGTGVAVPSGSGDFREERTFLNGVWPGYFRMLEIPLVGGREFTRTDNPGAPPVVIVNETLARRLFGDRNALGQAIRLADETRPREVVGVARDSKYDERSESPTPFLYLPLAQESPIPSATFMVRTAGAPRAFEAALRRIVHDLDPALPLYDVRTMDEVLAQRADKQWAISVLLSVLGALALGLAAVGLYGVMACTVTGRTREMGVRLALGARASEVMWLVLRDALRLALLGIAIGAVLALPVAPAPGAVGFGFDVGDAATFVGASIFLAAVGLLAAYVPARRATRVDPIAALRWE